MEKMRDREREIVTREQRQRFDLLSSPVTLTYHVVNLIGEQVHITRSTGSSSRVSLMLIAALNLVFLPHPS